MRRCLVKQQSFLLSEFHIATFFSILMKFPSLLYGTILGFVKSQKVSSTECSSSIGFTIVLNTDSLPRLRDCLPVVSPLQGVECTSLTFPKW